MSLYIFFFILMYIYIHLHINKCMYMYMYKYIYIYIYLGVVTNANVVFCTFVSNRFYYVCYLQCLTFVLRLLQNALRLLYVISTCLVLRLLRNALRLLYVCSFTTYVRYTFVTFVIRWLQVTQFSFYRLLLCCAPTSWRTAHPNVESRIHSEYVYDTLV